MTKHRHSDTHPHNRDRELGRFAFADLARTALYSSNIASAKRGLPMPDSSRGFCNASYFSPDYHPPVYGSKKKDPSKSSSIKSSSRGDRSVPQTGSARLDGSRAARTAPLPAEKEHAQALRIRKKTRRDSPSQRVQSSVRLSTAIAVPRISKPQANGRRSDSTSDIVCAGISHGSRSTRSERSKKSNPTTPRLHATLETRSTPFLPKDKDKEHRPAEIVSTRRQGLGLRSTRNIPRGEVIMRERPFIRFSHPLTLTAPFQALQSISAKKRALFLSFTATVPGVEDEWLAIAETNAIPLGVGLPEDEEQLNGGKSNVGDLGDDSACGMTGEERGKLEEGETGNTVGNASGMFETISRVNHSCAPNAAWRWDSASQELSKCAD